MQQLGGGGATRVTALLFVRLWSEAAVSNPRTDSRHLMDSHPGSHKLRASFSRNPCTGVCRCTSGGGCVAATMLRAELDPDELQFPVYAFSWKLQALSRLQSSKIVPSDRFCQCSCCLGEETDPWCFLLCNLPRILQEESFLREDLKDVKE